MAEFRVRFVGDLGNLAAFNSAIRNSLSSNAATLERANSSVVSRALGQPVRPSTSSGPGLFIRNATTEIDRLNNSFVQSGTVVRRYVDGFTTETKRIKDSLTGLQYNQTVSKPIFSESFYSSFRKAQGNVEAYERAIAQLAPIEKRALAQERLAGIKTARINTAESQLNSYYQLKPKNQTEAQRQSVFNSLNRVSPGLLTSPSDLEDIEGSLKGTVSRIQSNLHTQRLTIQKSLGTELNALKNDPVVRQISQDAFFAATSPEGRIGREAVNVLNRYPQVRSDLETKAGLGGGSPFLLQDKKTLNPSYAIAAQEQDFQINNVYRDMERNLTRVSGSIRGTDGIMQQFSYTIDKNGNTINAWGRNLSGARGFLNQTGRDLIKVIEYSAAAAIVFTSLGAAVSAFSSINQLQVNLQRFAITARLSGDETQEMFKGLAQVAFETATPIEDLVTAADDMALATRRANQSTADWHQSILELATAVGILTNITGLDTVKANDLLVASMKQLNLQTNQLIPLLNEITAAGGGQAGSITDIATGLASLAEAAEAASIPLTGQIAALQVISQVTGKSADQTATAFKNLFGAINSDTAVNKLEEFNVAVRDTAGNLRPFLDIYKDVADKINTGEIPAGRVNEVLRAISGGRTGRQADAAALVANIYKVFEVQQIAANSSNEALIANAKILTTNQAKITQFQNALKIETFEKFNQVVADLTATLAEFGTIFTKIFGLIPTQVITVTTEILALAGAIKLLTKLGAAINLGGIFGSIRKGLVGVPQQVQGLAESVGASSPVIAASYTSRLLNSQQQSIYLSQLLAGQRAAGPDLTTRIQNFVPPTAKLNSVGRYYDPSTGRLLSDAQARIATQTPSPQIGPVPFYGVPSPNRPQAIGPNDLNTAADIERRLGKALPLGVTLAVDGATKSTLDKFIGGLKNSANSRAGRFGIGAAIGGAAALAGGDNLSGLTQGIGSALLFTPAAPVGAGLLIAGTVIEHFNQEAEKAKQTALDLQTTIYNLTLQWKQDQAGVDAAQESYAKIQQGLKDTAEGTDEYIALQGQLGAATVDLSIALDSQRAGVEKMTKALKDLAEISGDKKFAQFATNFSSGGVFTREQLDTLIGSLSENILAAAGQAPYVPKNIGFDPATLNYGKPSNAPIVAYPTLGASASENISPLQLLNPSTFNGLSDLIQNIQNLGLNPFDPNGVNAGGRQLFKFPFENPEAVSAFETAATAKLETLKPEDREAFKQQVIAPFERAVAEFGLAASNVSNNILGAQATIQARQTLGVLYGENAATANADVNTAAGLNQLRNLPGANQKNIDEIISRLIANSLNAGATAPSEKDDGRPSFKTLSGFDPKTLKDAADAALEAYGIKLPDGIEKTTAEAEILRKQFGLTDDQIIRVVDNLGNLGTAADEALTEAINKTKEWADQALQGVGQKLLDLQARIQGGEFDKDPKQKNFLLEQLKAEQSAILKVSEAAQGLESSLGTEGAATAAQVLQQQLQVLNVNGFQGISANMEALNGAFFNWLGTLNLTDQQIRKVVPLWVQLFALAAKAAVLPQLALNGASGALGFWGIDPKKFSASLMENITKQMQSILRQIQRIGGNAPGTNIPSSSGSIKTGPSRTVDTLYLSKEQEAVNDPLALVRRAYQDALRLQAQIPGEAKRNKNNTVIVFDELNRIFKARGVSEELLRRALDKLTEQMSAFSAKADTIRRIRVGAGDFSAIANVPVNTQSGISLAGGDKVNITLNLNGTVLTPAQFQQFANQIAAALKKQLAS